MPAVPRVALSAGIAAALAIVVAPLSAQSVPVPAEVTTVLAKVGDSTADESAMLQAGRVVTRTEVAPEKLAASVLAAVKINTSLERALAYFRQLLSYVDGQATLAYGPVTQPAEASDFQLQIFDAADLTDLRACAPGKCDIRVGNSALEAARAAADWARPDANEQAQRWMRQALADTLSAYQRAGSAALRGYDERGEAVDMPALWEALESESPIPLNVAPGLQRYLGRYPGSTPAEATNEFYTDRQRFTGLKPIIGVTHLITWREPNVPTRVVVAQKQIVASHYFFGSLAVTMFVQDSATPPATYIVYTNQTRGDLLRGTQNSQQTGLRGRVGSIGASVQRRLGEQMVRQSAETLLSSMKSQLER